MRTCNERADPSDPRGYRELTDGLGGDSEDALIDCICAATGIHPDDLDGDDWPLERLIARLHADYAGKLSDEERYFLLAQLAELHQPSPFNTMTVTLSGGAQVFICKACRCQVHAEMNAPWEGHSPNCTYQRRAALMTKIDPDQARYLGV